MKEINLIGNPFDNLRKGTRYNRAPAGVKVNTLTQDQINFMIQNNISLNQDFINWHYIWQYAHQ